VTYIASWQTGGKQLVAAAAVGDDLSRAIHVMYGSEYVMLWHKGAMALLNARSHPATYRCPINIVDCMLYDNLFDYIS